MRPFSLFYASIHIVLYVTLFYPLRKWSFKMANLHKSDTALLQYGKQHGKHLNEEIKNNEEQYQHHVVLVSWNGIVFLTSSLGIIFHFDFIHLPNMVLGFVTSLHRNNMMKYNILRRAQE
uniref:Uncharacterized protein n=1 Tax=Cacopsylla melanoneura TaxID=428564 RepID=A0A8D8XEN6_9HEMI